MKTIKIFCTTWFLTASLGFWLVMPTFAQAPVLDVKEIIKKEEAKRLLVKNIDNQYKEPISLTIPSINVNTNIEQVGVEPDGSMGVPKNYANTAWLKTSSKTGQNGNLVISGHFDTNYGAPAAFYNLNSVKIGDTVKVTSLVNEKVKVSKEYIITQKFLASPENKDHIKIAYKETKDPTLTLITCNGIWDPIKQEYSHRVVVKGEIVRK